jgi:hypothetical protein
LASRSFSSKNFWVDGFVFPLEKKSMKSNGNYNYGMLLPLACGQHEDVAHEDSRVT